ncbi:MAG: HDIG domain-containing protein [Treponema sp.]|jgi:putative nucleotidyltransferase with HDIG domain|nr:HDIG domain-containing protein [Treponema sp.]
MKFTDAQALLDKYVNGETLKRHCLTVAVALEYWAREYGEADPETWRCVGLLHDIDFELYPKEHCVKAKEILEAEKANFPGLTDSMIHAILSHGWKLCNDVEPVSQMEKTLYTVDELTGLIYACALMRPSKSVMDMEVKSVLKKFKTPAFAAGCNRDVISEGATLMGMDLNRVIEKTILAMRTEAAALGV